MRGALILALAAFPAHADTTYAWGMLEGYRSTITLQPTDAPGAVAEVVFDNRKVHTDDEVSFVLDLDGLSVTVDASVGRGLTPDRFTVTPPDGYVAMPPELDVQEDGVGVILVMPWIGF